MSEQSAGTDRRGELKKTLSSADPIEGECTRCGDVRRVWPVEYPADIAMEVEWDYARLCLYCWRDMGREFLSARSLHTDTDRLREDQ